jgi:hypothetical protein
MQVISRISVSFVIQHNDMHIFRWTNTTFGLRDGVPGGPIVLFDKHGRVIIVSSFNNFMSSVNEHESLAGGILSYGIMGSVEYIPEGHSVQTILYYGEHGINMVCLYIRLWKLCSLDFQNIHYMMAMPTR